MPFDLCNALDSFPRCMMSIPSNFVGKCIEVFMDDFTVYGNNFDECLSSLKLILKRCIETNLVLNYKKGHFMASHDSVLKRYRGRQGLDRCYSKLAISILY